MASVSNARPNVSRETSKWSTSVDKDRLNQGKEINLLRSQVDFLLKAQTGGSSLLGSTVFNQPQPQLVQGFGSTTVGAGPGDDDVVISMGGAYNFPTGFTKVLVLFTFNTIFSDASTTGITLLNQGVAVSSVPNWVADPMGNTFYTDQVETVTWATGDKHVTISVSGVLEVTQSMVGSNTFYLGGLVGAASATSGATIECYANGAGIFLFTKEG